MVRLFKTISVPLCCVFFLMIRRPPRSTLFPSTTLLRSFPHGDFAVGFRQGAILKRQRKYGVEARDQSTRDGSRCTWGAKTLQESSGASHKPLGVNNLSRSTRPQSRRHHEPADAFNHPTASQDVAFANQWQGGSRLRRPTESLHPRTSIQPMSPIRRIPCILRCCFQLTDDGNAVNRARQVRSEKPRKRRNTS